MERRGRAPIDRSAVAHAVGPFGHSTTLPAEVYTSNEVFQWEKRSFFESSWACVGRADDLSAPGDRRALRVGDEGIMLVRDEQRGLHAFYNVCRHRGHELMEPDSANNARVVRCPYHAWVYGLNGKLKGAPHFGDAPGFDVSDYHLIPVPVAEWHGWLFVNASGDGVDFAAHVGNLDELVAAHEPERLVGAARHDYVVQANWKIVVENYHECYHCPSIHPQLCRVSPPDSGYPVEPTGAWVGGTMDLVDHAETMSLDGASDGVPLRGLDAEQRRQIFYYGLFPNLLISLHPDYVMTHRIEPLAPGSSRIECEWLFAPEAVEREGFDPAYASDFWDITNKQDWRACEAVQRGVSSRGYRQGPLAPEEDEVHQFIAMVARGYLGEGIVPQPTRLHS